MAYMRRGALVERFTITASSAGTLTLLNNSTTFQVITGTQSHTIQLPDATTCDGGSTGKGGQKFYIVNNSTQRIVINNAGGTRVLFLPSKAEALIVLTDDTSANGVWRYSVPTIIDQPMRASAGEPADSKVYFKANTVTDFDGTELVTPPVKGLIPTVPASTHDLQSGATTGATFNNAALPTTTVGQFRRIGYSLLPTGIIQVLYTVAAATEGALADPGTVFAKGALPIAWVDVVATGANAFKTIGSSSSIVENYAGGASRIHKFGSGGGGGSGTGDANSFLEDLKAFLREAHYQWMTPNIFSISETALTDLVNTTALYDVANSLFEIDLGQTFRSTQLLGARFLADTEADVAEVDLQLQYDLTGVDADPDVFVSRNGGNEWQQVTMNRIGVSDKYQGSHTFSNESVYQNLYAYFSANADTSISLNATTTKAIAQPLVATEKDKVKKITLYVEKSGTPVGNIIFKVVKDTAGSPSSDPNDLMFSKIVNASSISGITTIPMDSDIIFVNGQTYWIVVETDDLYKTNNHAINVLQLRADSTPSITVAKAYNSSWTAASYAAVYLVQGFKFDLRVRIDASMNDTKLKGFGIFFAKQQAGVPVGDTPEVYRYSFSGDANEYSFTLPFTPDPDFLEVWDVGAGNVYSYPAFDIAGNVVNFLPGTFLSPGETIQLKFKQGSGFFDNSDLNRNLLAANHLGSTSGSNTLQSPGRGIMLADEANSLKEIAIDSDSGLRILNPSTLEVVDYHYGAADNLLYNSDFIYTQRNEAKTYSAHADGYLSDRWHRSGLAAANYTQVVASPATGVYSALRFGRISGSSSTAMQSLIQALPTKDSIKLAGRYACVSFIAKKGSNFSGTALRYFVLGGTGTDQGPVVSWTGELNITGSQTVDANSLSTSTYQKFYFVFQVPASFTQLKLQFFYTPIGTAGANDWVEISEVMLNEGRGPAKWSLKGKDYGGELEKLQEYYLKSYSTGLSPGTASQAGEHPITLPLAVSAASYVQQAYRFPKSMRSTPVVTLWNPLSSNTPGAVHVSGTSRAASAADIGTTGFGAILNSSGVAWADQSIVLYHVTADAEL